MPAPLSAAPRAGGERTRIVWLYPKIEKPMGGTNFVISAATELHRDFDVLIIAQKTTPGMGAECAAHGLQLVDLKQPSFTDPLFWLAYPWVMAKTTAALRKHLKPRDVVVTSMYPMDVAANRLGRNDVQIVYEPFVFFHDRFYMAGRGLAVRVFFRLMARMFGKAEKQAVRGAGQVLTLSHFEAARLEKVYGRKAHVIYEGVDQKVFHPEVEPLSQYDGQSVVLHSTGFDRFKGTDTVIAAVPELARRIPGLQVVMTWTREDAGALARYRAFLAQHDCAASVVFLGLVPYHLLPRLYRTARVYVEPGRDRAMSLSVKEAMACGTPAVRGREGYEEVTDGVEGFLVDGDDVAAFTEKVVSLCQDDALRARMSQAGLARIERQFTWKSVAARIVGLVGGEPLEASA